MKKNKNKIIGILIAVYIFYVVPLLTMYYGSFFDGKKLRALWFLNFIGMYEMVFGKHYLIAFVLFLLPIIVFIFGLGNKGLKIDGEYGTARFSDVDELYTESEFEYYKIDDVKNNEYIKYLDESGKLEYGKGAGPIIYYDRKGNVALIDTSNDHVYCVASTGDGKDRREVSQLIKTVIDHGECAVINDPKKEQFKRWKKYAIKKGFNVKCIDLRKNDWEDRWNPLEEVISHVKNNEFEEAQLESSMIANSLEPGGSGVNEDNKIWLEGRRAVITALSLSLCMQNIPKVYKNFSSVYRTLAEKGEIKIDSDGNERCDLNDWFNSPERSIMEKISYAPAKLALDRTKMSFFVNIATSLSTFALNKIADQMSESDFDIKDLADMSKKPTLIFVIYPYETSNMDKIVNLFYDTVFRRLTVESMKFKDNYIPRRIHMIFNEFTNLPRQNEFVKKLTVSRASNIRYYLYVQSDANLAELYGEHVKDIIKNNCKLKIFISANDNKEAKLISDTLGNKTIQVTSLNSPTTFSLFNTSKNQTQSLTGRALMTADEILSEIKKGYAIVVKSKIRPYKAYLSDISEFKFTEYINELNSTEDDIETKRVVHLNKAYVLGDIINTKPNKVNKLRKI
ncbi:MAG: type IV secretory system conjugative DNA transfer family protein [Erysipelotrichaceae bacterium]|nr:type IV secretory system conjugative DNA transfer family protein [Erysipelotrichaceae bacterium]